MLDYQRVTAPLRTRSGEPLLLLHGLGTSRRDFTAVLPALTDRFDVINVDLPGIGRSPHLEQRPTVAAITDAVEHTLDVEGLGRVDVLGNSLGARIALELAVRGRARSVVADRPVRCQHPAGAGLPGRHHGAGPDRHAGGEATDRLGVPFVSWPRCAPGAAEGVAVEHLAGGGDRRA